MTSSSRPHARALSPPRFGLHDEALASSVDHIDNFYLVLWFAALALCGLLLIVYWQLALIVLLVLSIWTCVCMPPQRAWSLGLQRYYGLSPYEIARERSLAVFRQLSNREVVETIQLYMDRHHLTFHEALRRWYVTADDYIYFSSRRSPGQAQADRMAAAAAPTMIGV